MGGDLMNKYKLITSVPFGDTECKIKSDFRDILEIIEILNNPDLTDGEKTLIALEYFYLDDIYLEYIEQAITEMFCFISYSDNSYSESSSHSRSEKPLYDWQQDFDIIVAPINKILGFDCRGVEYLHWWTFLSAFMEIGECTFNTFVGIRDKLNRHKKLDKWEEKVYKDNKDRIILKRKYDSTTQEMIDEIMGRR